MALTQICRNKLSKFDYWYIFILSIYFGGAVKETLGLFYFTGFISVGIPFVMTLYLYIKKHIILTDVFFKTILFFVIWLLFQYIVNGYFNIVDFSFYIYNIFIAYILIRYYGKNLFYLFENAIYILSFISLVFWLICLCGGQQLLTSLAPFNGTGLSDASYGIYTIMRPSDDSLYILYRNAGFASEPGHFSGLVCFAIFFNLLINNFNLKNKHFYVLLITLLSTQSTTGYMIFCCAIIPFYLYNVRSNKTKYLMLPIIIIVVYNLYTSPVISEKLDSTSASEEMRDKVISYANKNSDYKLVLQRFDSFVVEMQNFVHDPIIGYGKWNYSFFYQNITTNIGVSNAIGTLFAKYGFIIAILYLFFLTKSSKRIIELYGKKGWLFLYLMVLGFMFSYDHEARCYILFFTLFSLFYKREKLQMIKNNNVIRE